MTLQQERSEHVRESAGERVLSAVLCFLIFAFICWVAGAGCGCDNIPPPVHLDMGQEDAMPAMGCLPCSTTLPAINCVPSLCATLPNGMHCCVR